jgi:transposase
MLNFKILQFHQVQIMMNYKTLFKLITKLKMKTTKKNSKTFLRKIN